MHDLRVLFVQNRVCARTWRAAKVLADAGHAPYLLELDEPSPQHDYSVFRERIPVPVKRDIRSMVVGKRTIVRALRETVRARDIDLIHAHNGPDNLGAWAIRHAGVPVLHDIHDLQSAQTIKFSKPLFRPLIHALYKRWEHYAVRHAAAVLVPTDAMQRRLRSEHPRARIEVIENKALPGRIERLPKRSAKDGNVHVAYAGSFSLAAGSERNFLPGIEKLSTGRIHTHIYAVMFSDSDRRALQDAVRANPNVHYHDPVPHSRLITELTQYDFGLVHFPVLTDNIRMASATKLYEYILAGIPVIANKEGRIGHFVDENGCGITVERLEDAGPLLRTDRTYRLPVEKAVLHDEEFLALYRDLVAHAKADAQGKR